MEINVPMLVYHLNVHTYIIHFLTESQANKSEMCFGESIMACSFYYVKNYHIL